MARIAPHDVSKILETELETSALMTFIEDANTIVNNRCEPYTDDTDALADVETYLAAHLASAKEPRVSTVSGAVTEVELDADGDRYWHQAVLIDPTGRLDIPTRGYFATTT